MKLYASNFEALANNNKTREYRLNDSKRRLIKPSDTIRFQKLPDFDEEVIAEVL